MATRKIDYSEPGDFFPKSIRDKAFGTAKKTEKKTTSKKSTSKKK